MAKITLDLNSFKALASETRLDIIRALDGKKLNLNEISSATKLHKVTLHEHLSKLVEAGFVKKKEREGHKWVYYKLSWKGESLLHPENTRIAVMFSATIISLCIGILGFVNLAREKIATASHEYLETKSNTPPTEEILDAERMLGGSTSAGQNPFFYVALGCIILFILLLIVSILSLIHI